MPRVSCRVICIPSHVRAIFPRCWARAWLRLQTASCRSDRLRSPSRRVRSAVECLCATDGLSQAWSCLQLVEQHPQPSCPVRGTVGYWLKRRQLRPKAVDRVGPCRERVLLGRHIRVAVLEVRHHVSVHDAVDATYGAVPSKCHEVRRFGGPSAFTVGMEVGELIGDDLLESCSPTRSFVVEHDAVGPTLSDIAHLHDLLEICPQLIEPESFAPFAVRLDRLD